MDKKRKIDDSGSGTITKKRKNLKNEVNPVQLPETRNTLTAMPDHILEKILSYLDLEDKKSFSESCKTLNNIFNCRSNMKSVWLKVQKNQKVSEISRPYVNMFWPCVGPVDDVQQTIPKRLWKRLTTSLTAFRIDISKYDENAEFPELLKCALNAKKLFDCLPFFVNLTHLDLVVPYKFMENRLLNLKSKKPADVDNPTKMENLQVLQINYELFSFLDGRYIDFDIKKLQAIIFRRCSNDEIGGMFSNETFNKIRSLISNQINLQKLHLLDGCFIHQIFDFPLIVQSQLREFKFSPNRFSSEFNLTRQDNLFDFVQSQRNLKVMECNLGRQVNKSDKMKRFARSIPNRPLKSQRLMITESRSDIDWCEKYSMQEMIEISIEPANLSTKKLQLVIGSSISATNQNQIIPMIVTKFPNLTSLDIVIGTNKQTDQENILGALKDFQSLETLKLTGFSSQHLRRVISILYLKEFVFNHSYRTNNEAADLIDFIQRHQSLENIKLLQSNDDLMNVIKNALRLKKLSRFTLEGFGNYYNSRNRKSLFMSWIKKHSKRGLVFRVPPIKLMKRYDNEIVKKIKGRWQPENDVLN